MWFQMKLCSWATSGRSMLRLLLLSVSEDTDPWTQQGQIFFIKPILKPKFISCVMQSHYLTRTLTSEWINYIFWHNIILVLFSPPVTQDVTISPMVDQGTDLLMNQADVGKWSRWLEERTWLSFPSYDSIVWSGFQYETGCIHVSLIAE